MHLATDLVNPFAPQFVSHGFSTAVALNKGAGIWSPDTSIIRSPVYSHCRAAENSVGKSAAVGDAVGEKSDYI